MTRMSINDRMVAVSGDKILTSARNLAKLGRAADLRVEMKQI